MANMDFGVGAGVAEVDGPGAFSTLFNWLGAILSVVLIVGLAQWGYRLAMRDVTGVPVVRALEGPMRIAPQDPGGQRAAHQGFAVNSIAAEGSAAAPADRLILAPAPLDLAADDLPRPVLAEASTAPGDIAVAALDDVSTGDAVVEDAVPLSATILPPQSGAAIIPASVAGVSLSPLPRLRPVGDLTAEAVATTVALAVSGAVTEIDPATIAVGTRLVQFGAFDNADAARAAWVSLDGQFGDFMHDKTRIVQEAVSGGKTFYRLRAMGFADINDARRFCSALLAERQACIPVVVR